MKKRFVSAVVAIMAAFGMFVASSTPAQAAVTGVVYNVSRISPNWITITGQWPPAKPVRVLYSGQYGLAKGFTSGWPCYSQWGYRYSAGVWHEMHTTGALYLNCRNS